MKRIFLMFILCTVFIAVGATAASAEQTRVQVVIDEHVVPTTVSIDATNVHTTFVGETKSESGLVKSSRQIALPATLVGTLLLVSMLFGTTKLVQRAPA